MKKPIVLMILDGYGYREEPYGNAIKAANTPNMDALWAKWPHTTIGASGLAVGLPVGQMGNSEVGHTNLGAGRVVYQELTRLSKAIEDKVFFQNQVLKGCMEKALKEKKSLHLLGLVSHGGVHSHDTHLYALLELAKQVGLTQVYVHCFTDGRDVPPESGAESIAQLEKKMKELGVGKIATITGRYYAMDRDNRWERVERAYNVLVYGQGAENTDPVKAMKDSYKAGVTDEFVNPVICDPKGIIQPEDTVLFFNFRPDRGRELTRALVDPNFTGFNSRKDLSLNYVTMTSYDATMPNVQVAYPPEILTHTLGELVSKNGLNQLRIAETEKYPHVTFFFNGGEETVFPGEDRALIPSPKVVTYDLQPEMSAREVTEEMLRRLETREYDLIILNFANCDMVGHTGVFAAAVAAVETVDQCVGKVVSKVLEQEGILLITADHGNADQMLEPDGSPFTAHTTNPVPLLLVGLDEKVTLKKEGGALCDLAPTILELLKLPKPKEMTGHSLIE